MSLIAFVGFKGSGKDTAANGLIENFGYKGFSFADSLKDALATIFQWDRELLSGATPEAREWREEVDPWWAEKLGMPDFTPRLAMQKFGTDVMRRNFGQDIWVLNVERKLSRITTPIVLVDGRFPNEIAMARRFGGKVLRIRRGPDPDWFDIAAIANRERPALTIVAPHEQEPETLAALCRRTGDAGLANYYMRNVVKVHESEWAWIGTEVDATVENNGTIAMLQDKVARLCIL